MIRHITVKAYTNSLSGPGAAQGWAWGRGWWDGGGVDYVLAQVNIGRLRAPLDSPELAGFVAALDPVNAAADAAPGFVWRLQTEDGNATAVRAFEWDEAGSAGVIVNLSVWESAEALAAFVYSDVHRRVLARRRQWFERMTEAYTALWWIPRGSVPGTADAEDRVRRLRAQGPTAGGVHAAGAVPAPGGDGLPQAGREDWACPADSIEGSFSCTAQCMVPPAAAAGTYPSHQARAG